MATSRNGPKSRTAKKKAAARSQRNGRPKYQPLPDLPPDEFEILKADIAQRGLQYPVIQDEKGNTLDGHQRERALRELGIKNYPVKVIAGLSSEEKRHYALAINIKRRSLTTAQKRTLIEQELRRTPDIANNWWAEILAVDKATVAAARRRLEATCEIPKLKKLRGKDGKSRAAKYRQVVANTAAELRVARQVVKSLPPSCNGKLFDVVTASRRARKAVRQRTWKGKVIEPSADEDIRLYHCRFQRLEKVAGIRPRSINLILTDIPYGREFLPELDNLGAFAERVLVNGGLFVSFVGQYYLPQVLETLTGHMTYRWTMASIWDGDGNVVHPLQVASQWKPIVVFSKGRWKIEVRWPDLLRITSKEKLHKWQQPLATIESLVELFAKSDQLVCDPCAGAFTSALASRNMGRRFVGCDSDKECVLFGQERLAEGKPRRPR